MCGRRSNNWGETGGTATIQCGRSDKTRGGGGKVQSRGGKAATWRAKATGGCKIGWSHGIKTGKDAGIICIQHKLEAKKQAYSNAQKAAGIDIDDAGNDDSSDSAPENQPVSYPFIYSLYSILITLHSSIRGPQSRTRHVGRKRLANGCLKLLMKLWVVCSLSKCLI